ncbi:3-phosphoshikimate 1-carboxyvinyltransferase [Chloroflexota bacterium]
MAKGEAAMKQSIRAPYSLEGAVEPPSDKSISHRAAILNSIAEGEARITNFSSSGDCNATISCLQALGVQIEQDEHSRLIIRGAGKEGLKEAGDVLDAKNSATAMRLLTGLLAAQPFQSIITGDESLLSRPMDRIIQPLRLMGAQLWGRNNDSRAPLVINGGKLHGIRYTLPVASAQVKSALLLAALFAQDATAIIEPMPSRDHTERMLKAMGAGIKVDGDCITLSPGSLKTLDVVIPGDISSAAYWLVAGSIHPRAKISLPNTGINPTRDGIIEVLRSMGASISVDNKRVVSGEPVADLLVESSDLSGIEIGGSLIPRVIDEIPLIAVAASIAQGKTVIRDARELRVKETDRITSTASELLKLGAIIEELPDGMIVHGGKRLKGAQCDSHLDHRLAMALGVGALVAEGETAIDNAEAADISYPGFWQDLDRLSTGKS